MRAVVDVNVVISGLLSPKGAAANVLRAIDRGELELVASGELLDELERALGYAKLRTHIDKTEALDVVRWMRETATIDRSPQATPPVRCVDPDDDYLIALACAHGAALVTGDKHLLSLADQIPVFSPPDFLALLAKT